MWVNVFLEERRKSVGVVLSLEDFARDVIYFILFCKIIR